MKEKILNKSLELFAEKGFEAVSVSMISEGLGLTKGALYKHYESKKAIFDAIIKRMEDTDYLIGKKFDLPPDVFDKIPEQYKNSSLEQLFAFGFAMFLYWTGDEFAAKFRRILTIEQFNSGVISSLYQQYLGTGPLLYILELLKGTEEIKSCNIPANQLALDFYSPIYTLINLFDSADNKQQITDMVKEHIENFMCRIVNAEVMKYALSSKYSSPEFMALISGPNPLKLEEELLKNNHIKQAAVVCDLGCRKGLTSAFLAKEYGFKVYATDSWSDAEENGEFFNSLGFGAEQIIPVKADVMSLPFDTEFFDAVISIDSYSYFGRDPSFLDEKLLPFVKPGGYIYIAIPGMKKDCHDNLPEELLLSWNAEQLDFLHDKEYWRNIVKQAEGAEIISVAEMKGNKEVWEDWLSLDNEYACNDRKAMEAGAGKYLNFIQIILRKK